MAFLKYLPIIGILLILIGIILIFISGFSSTKDSNVKVAAGGFIGFIPFGFFNDKRMFYALLIFILITYILFLIFRKTL